MKRISVPVSDRLYLEYDQKVPHGIKAAVARALIRIALRASSDTMYKLAINEEAPEKFELTVKEVT